MNREAIEKLAAGEPPRLPRTVAGRVEAAFPHGIASVLVDGTRTVVGCDNGLGAEEGWRVVVGEDPSPWPTLPTILARLEEGEGDGR